MAAGLDSLVPGEGEILGQVRDAFEAGAPGPLLDRTFRMALHAGRRARIETAIGESPASVPSAAAALAQQVFEGLDGRRVVLVGAGRTSELTARNLRSRGAIIVTVVNRTVDRAERLASSLGAGAATLGELSPALADADVVVSSTSAPGFILTADELAPALRARRGRPVLFVDLAVPRDVDPSLASIDGCFVYDVDDLEAVVSASLQGRRAKAVAPSGSWQRRRSASVPGRPHSPSCRRSPRSGRWRRRSAQSELARVEARLGRLPESDRAVVDTVTAQIVNKLLHLPTVRMKEAAVTPDGLVYADVVRHLFGLGEEDKA